MSEHHSRLVPVTVNLHLTPACNYRCGFCFAVFRGLHAARGPEEWIALIQLLAANPILLGRGRIDKLTFAGGEPTLVRYLPQLLHAKEAGFVTCLVTNGTGLTDAFLEECAPYLDWVALSIDSPSEATNAALGRGTGAHLETTWAAVERLRRYPHIRLKLNTVVTKLNWQEDFHELVTRIRPRRWKVLQATRIEDQNGATIADYEVTAEQFADFCERHQDLRPVPETEEQIKGSYLMIDPHRRFFGNSQDRYVYSDPVLEIGAEEAVRQVGWTPEAFLARGGSYDWRDSGESARALCVAIEGLDGSGKSTIARILAQRLGATLVKNPPDVLAKERAAADASPEPERRAWYAHANRLAGEEAMRHRRAGRAVVMDRSMASTVAFGAACGGRVAGPADWPDDVFRPDLLVLLEVPESVRIERVRSRSTAETDEEARLRTDGSFRERVLAGYAALGAVAVPADRTPDEIVDPILRLLDGGSAS